MLSARMLPGTLPGEPGEEHPCPARAHQRGADVLELVGRAAAELPDRLERQVEAVDVPLADKAPVGVARQRPGRTEVAVGDEVPGLAGAAEAQSFQLHEQDG